MSDMRLSCRTLTLRTISTFDVRSALIRVFRWRPRQAKEPLAKLSFSTSFSLGFTVGLHF